MWLEHSDEPSFRRSRLNAEDCMKFASFDNVLMASALVSFAVFLAWSVKIIAEGV
jgi:hypothetical protein